MVPSTPELRELRETVTLGCCLPPVKYYIEENLTFVWVLYDPDGRTRDTYIVTMSASSRIHFSINCTAKHMLVIVGWIETLKIEVEEPQLMDPK